MKNLDKIALEDGMILSGSEMKEIAGGGDNLRDCRLCEWPWCKGKSCERGGGLGGGVCRLVEGTEYLTCM